MFERFTDGARKVVVLAQEESRLLGHNYIGTEHILLGLIQGGNGVAARALESLGVSLEAVRGQVVGIIGHGGKAPSGHIPFTPGAKEVLELSLREALQLGHSYIGTEHILLGLIREGEGVAAQVLAQVGAGLDRVRSAVIAIPKRPSSTRVGMRVPLYPVGGASSVDRPSSTHCVFCGRDLWEVDHYVRGEGAAICDVCVEACVDAVKGAADPATRGLSLPPRVFGADPEGSVAVEKIIATFRAVFGPTTDEARAAALEDGEALTPFFHQAIERSGLRTTEVHVHRIRYSSGDAAEVSFSLVFDGGGKVPLTGTAVQRGDRWLLSRESAVLLLGAGGVHIPPKEETG